MIKTRIASTAALFTFGLAALGGTIAAPANAAPSASGSSSTSASTGTDPHNGKTQRDQHEQSKKHPNKFNPQPTTGPSSASASTVGSNQHTVGSTPNPAFNQQTTGLTPQVRIDQSWGNACESGVC